MKTDSPQFRAILIVASILLLLLLCCCCAFNTIIPDTTGWGPEDFFSAPPDDTNNSEVLSENTIQTYPVTDIVDGDTIKIDYEGTIEPVRLVGIDTPEVDSNDCYSAEAEEEMKRLVDGRDVRIEFDGPQDDRDYFDRLLLYIWVTDEHGEEIFANEYMVENGFAKVYRDKPSTYRDVFEEAEKNAQEQQLGIWKDCACEDKADQEESRACSECKVATVSYYNVDCSLRQESVEDTTCTAECPTEPTIPTGSTTTKTTTTPAPTTTTKNCQYSCTSPDRDCSDFSTHAQAQAFFDCCGFTKYNDPMRLDGRYDNVDDGIACESLP